MFFDQLNERNALVQSILAFEKLGLSRLRESAKPTLTSSAPEESFSSTKRQM
jgi:hypothetical protein